MKIGRVLLMFLSVLVLLFATVASQPLNKRHEVGLRMGMWNQVTDSRVAIGDDNIISVVQDNGIMAGVYYGHWLGENLALSISMGVMAAEMESSIDYLSVSSEAAYVSRILMGLKYYFPKSTQGSSVRPYIGGAVGPFIGSQERTESGLTVVVESRTEVAMGGQVSFGVDFVISRRFLFDLGVGYNVISDFDEPIGGSENYSGPEFGFGLSLLLGGGKKI